MTGRDPQHLTRRQRRAIRGFSRPDRDRYPGLSAGSECRCGRGFTGRTSREAIGRRRAHERTHGNTVSG